MSYARKKDPDAWFTEDLYNRVSDEVVLGQKLMVIVLAFNVLYYAGYALFYIFFMHELLDMIALSLPKFASQMALPDVQPIIDALLSPQMQTRITSGAIYSLLSQVLVLIFVYMGRSWARVMTGLSSLLSGLGSLALGYFFAVSLDDYILGALLFGLGFIFFYTGGLLLFSYSVKVYSMYMRA